MTTTETVEPYVIPRKSDQELRQLAIDINEGRVFGSWSVPPHENIGAIFMPLGLMEAPPPPNAGHCYEYLAKAGPLAINGLPMFFSLTWLAQDDCQPLYELLKELREHKAAFVGPSEER